MAIKHGDVMGALHDAPIQRTVAAPKKRASVAVAKPEGNGKPFNIYMHPEDGKQLRALAAFLIHETGLRVSDSQVVKAALLAARGERDLVSAFHEVASRDKRFKKTTE